MPSRPFRIFAALAGALLLTPALTDASASYPDRVRAVTPQQVLEAARRYLAPDRMIISVVGPLEQIGAAPMIESEPQLSAWGTVERVDGGR